MNRREFLNRGLNLSAGLIGMNFGAKALGAGIGAMALPNLLFANDKKLTIWGVPALISLPIATVVSQGKAREKIALNFREWRTPDQLRAGFVSNDFIVAASPVNVGVSLYNQGIDVKMFNILTNGLNYIFTKDKAITSLKDLEGKKLILPFKNDLPDIIFQALCNAHKIDIKKIQIQYVQTPPEAVNLFMSKDEFDAVVAQEPMASIMGFLSKRKGISVYRSMDVQKLWSETFKQCPKIPQAGLIVKGKFYEENLEFFNVLHKDFVDSISWIYENQDLAAKLGAKYLPVPKMGLKAAIPHSNLTALRCAEIADNLDRFFDIVYELNPKLLGGKKPPTSLYV